MYNTDTDDEKNMKKWRKRKSRKTDVNGKITHFIEVDKSLKRMMTDLDLLCLEMECPSCTGTKQERKEPASI